MISNALVLDDRKLELESSHRVEKSEATSMCQIPWPPMLSFSSYVIYLGGAVRECEFRGFFFSTFDAEIIWSPSFSDDGF